MGEGGGDVTPPKEVQSNTACFPAKKLARQLDFTVGLSGVSSSGVVLPEHPQSTQEMAEAPPSTLAAATVTEQQQQQIKPPPMVVTSPVQPPTATSSRVP